MIQSKNIVKSKIRWTASSLEHIQKHGILKGHVMEIFTDKQRIVLDGKYAKNRYRLIGRCGKRILSVVVAEDNKKFTLFTARDASKEERVVYRKNKDV